MSVVVGIGSNAGKSISYFNASVPIAGGARSILKDCHPSTQVPLDFQVNYVQITDNKGNPNVSVTFTFEDGQKATVKSGQKADVKSVPIKGARVDAK